MYADHQALIQDHIWQSEEGLLRAMLFVRLSIRRHLEAVGPLVERVIAEGPETAAGMTKQERRSLREIYDAVPDIFAGDYRHHNDPTALISRVLQIHGFAIVKAAFVAQLALGLGGCLDSHNVKRFNLKISDFKGTGTWKAVQGRLTLYLALCEQIGGSEYLWDSWCNHVARLRPLIWKDGEAVSRYHVDVICGSPAVQDEYFTQDE
jgi:hypothetical protein